MFFFSGGCGRGGRVCGWGRGEGGGGCWGMCGGCETVDFVEVECMWSNLLWSSGLFIYL